MTQHLVVHDEETWTNLLSSDEVVVHRITDGGLYDYWGIFGVVISDGTKVLVDNKGQMYSVDFQQSSFWLDMYGMLPGIMTFHQAVALQKGKLYTSTIIKILIVLE
jgi:hypothetical protein